MARLTEEKIKQIQEEYAKDPVYSHVAKKCGTTAATVKKYVSGEVPAPAKKKKDAVAEKLPSSNVMVETSETNQRIRELYQSGKSILDISKELDMGQGEVKLIIDLYGG